MQQLVLWSRNHADGEPIALMFSNQQEYESNARQLFELYHRSKEWGELIPTLAFGDPKRIVPLQVADLLVYEKTRREIELLKDPNAPFRPALRILGDANVRMIEIDHDPTVIRQLLFSRPSSRGRSGG